MRASLFVFFVVVVFFFSLHHFLKVSLLEKRGTF